MEPLLDITVWAVCGISVVPDVPAMLLCLYPPSTSQRGKCGLPLFPSIIMALQQHKTFAAYEAAWSLKGCVSKMAQKVKNACCVNLTC